MIVFCLINCFSVCEICILFSCVVIVIFFVVSSDFGEFLFWLFNVVKICYFGLVSLYFVYFFESDLFKLFVSMVIL